MEENLCLVTGGTGFVGKQLCEKLREDGYEIRLALRKAHTLDNIVSSDKVIVGNIGSDTQWDEALSRVAYVIHLAARVHVMHEKAADPLTEFRKINLDGTVRLAEQAANRGVRRFIFVSSIKVNGELTTGRPFTAEDLPNPGGPYAISKAEAENQLREIEKLTGMEVVIVRPPLIYGPDVKGNFLRLMKLLEHGLPLPFATISNKRSMVSLNNMNHFLMHCLEHELAAGETFLVSDGDDWSTPELIKSIAKHMHVAARIFPVPLPLLKLAGSLTGQPGVIDRLCNSLEIDISKNRKLLGWTPVQSPDEGVRETVEWYMNNKNG